MIVGYKNGDVVAGPERHVAFAINTEGHNDAGLAGSIASRFWPELASTGAIPLGESLSKITDGKVFHALVVHSLEQGWVESPKHIQACFNQLEIATDEQIASVAMGAGIIGMLSGADPRANIEAMHRSNKQILIYEL